MPKIVKLIQSLSTVELNKLQIKDIGKRLRERRESISLQLSELAHLTGVAEDDIRALESGEGGLTMTVLYKLAKALGLKPADLIEFGF